MARKGVLNSSRLRDLKKKRRMILGTKIALAALAFLVLLWILAYVARLPAFNISEIKISGEKAVDTESITEVVEKNLKTKHLWIFPKSNFLLLPKNQIKKELMVEFSRLENVSFNLQNLRTLLVSVSERENKYIWCGANMEIEFSENSEKGCFFMDASGYVFDQAPYFSGDVYFRFFGALKENYFFPEVFGKFISFIDVLPRFGFVPVSLYSKIDGDIEIHLSSDSSYLNSPKIIFKKNSDLEKISENLQAALDTEPLRTELKNKYSFLQYIDLRFGNKVYYKFDE
ncbi:hypothetical protein A3D42_01045 [Candidatus Nomurabacteria bacterium RIFCSPHIGHO2_02_FULL_41_18]|uniref:POTRA domain-containing protein n=1 Tax=Candidatus Nomurabacteria bacterium RIFCSPHIGHO2_02_FULL_41_18 TaxID=1801754 RepID=A0A1F6W726_9BACT|nr:MAG: hypothetical protein A2737_03250 [Candidatus Nomurabacteria bacterium RIFCSPHIGHO2_01_FULL_41_71]OGI77566.1 MAG: hypothetical protein A3D42_01045 [Candidatus Nomurabacteria bacterium RIFCSPHIGHO2_02_FULL_41_18]OGI89066.1 MAG: hypothetical protein A3B01_00625 [Candidatus Nomurabacteria bacterium RIFCSPLOWO2_01_FULL_41_52b]OGJ00433.1 MAG: hypothetical protein A3I90_00920 [Candidatus Nomurabacteria bacterium RIFCSPLOWO2_02_FULL_41_9]